MGAIGLYPWGLFNKTGRNWGEARRRELVSVSRCLSVWVIFTLRGVHAGCGRGEEDDRDPNQNQSSILPKTKARLFLASGSGQIPELRWPFSVFHSYHIRS